MKKILYMMVLLMTTVVLVGCQEGLLADKKAPVISGLNDITYTIGDPRPNLLASIQATDNVDEKENITISYDDSDVDYTTSGTYDIIYTAEDSKGNKATLTIKITVQTTSDDDGGQSSNFDLTIYYLNDTHGAIEKSEDQLGLANIGNLILDEKAKNPETTLFIGGGDLLQGNILSNYYYGSSMIDMFNVMQMDAFVLGNHEFDWGLDQVLRYRDVNSSQVQANYPILGANILLKDTMERPALVDPYVIIEKGGLNIGIIGLIGQGLESSIATARVAPYVFDDPVKWASYYAKELRTEQDVDIVLTVIHGNDYMTNQEVASLNGDSKVDAIFNGHSHSRYTQTIQRDGVDIPVIQSKANGEYLGKVTLSITQGIVSSFKAVNLHPYESSSNTSDRIEKDNRLLTEKSEIKLLIDEYKLVISDLLNDSIITSGEYYSESSLTQFMAEIIRKSVDADLGIHNYGGTRTSLNKGQEITVATLYQIFPFDNRVKYVYLKGEDIIDYANSSVAINFRSGLSLSNLNYQTYYKVATNDYIFDKVDYPFIYGEDPIDTGILIRDLLEEVLRNQAKSYQTFRIDQPVVITPVVYQFELKEEENV